ncbi:MAG: right-handed parallel beta-helix repeat-containing protein, partial [Nitrososphaerales archaeon]
MSNVEVDNFECWTVPILRLSSINAANNTAFLTGPTSKNDMCHGFITGHRYIVDNVKEALSQPGQWYFDQPNNQILYVAAPGENPNNETFIAPQLSELIEANGISHVTFHGLTFSNTNWVVPPTGWISLQGEGLGFSPVPAAINLTDSSYITFDTCVISHESGYGIEIFGTGTFQPTSQIPYNNQIMNSAIYDLGAGGILVGHPPSTSDTDANVAQYALIQNDLIEGTGRFLPAGYGIYILNSHNNMVGHNLIYDTYANAIGAAGGTYEYNINLPTLAHDNMIEYNLIYNINQGVTQDGGAIYTADGPAQGNRILNNVVHDVTADLNATTNGYGGWGIYFDSTSQNVIAENNLVYRTSHPSIHQNDGFNNTVTNNILAFGNLGIIDRAHNNASSLQVTHKIIYWDINSAPPENSFQRGIWTCYS